MTPAVVATFLAAFARASAFLFAAPLTSNPTIPRRIRAIAAAGIAIALVGVRPQIAPDALLMVLPGEILLGLIAGFAGRLVIAGAEVGGQLIGLPFALGFAATFDPTLGEQALVTRRLAFVMAGLAFLLTGGLEAGVRIIAAAPVDPFALHAGILRLMENSGEMFLLGLRFAAPATLAGLIAKLGVALASRAAPSLNVFSVMISAMLVVGGFTLLATAPAFAKEMAALGRRVSEAMAETVLP